jgi:hypothetical protein
MAQIGATLEAITPTKAREGMALRFSGRVLKALENYSTLVYAREMLAEAT